MTVISRRDELIHRIAAELDKPSVYMGGPSKASRRRAEKIVDLLPDYLNEGAVEAVKDRADLLRVLKTAADSLEDREPGVQNFLLNAHATYGDPDA